MFKPAYRWIVTLLLAASCAACSIAPQNPVTREQLMRTRVYSAFVIEESPEQVLNALNSYGEVVLEAKRNIPGKNYPVWVKILATADGLEILDYDR